MALHFKSIRFINFMAVGDDWCEIELDRYPTTLIMGKNGSGKSTLLDALTFVLFGDAFRNTNVPTLINDTNDRDMMVELDFSVNTKQYKIRRGLRPRVFEIYENGKMIDQEAKARDYQKFLEQNILKLNKKSFTQVVVLGSASFTPFMQMTSADRRFIIEDLLDIQIFSAMNIVLKQRLSEMKDEYTSLLSKIELQDEKIVLVESYIKRLRSDNVAAIADKKVQIEEYEKQRDVLQAKVDALGEEINNLLESTKSKGSIEQRIRKLESAEDKLKSNSSRINKEIEFYSNNDDCPTCKQGIDEAFKKDILEKKQTIVEEIKVALGNLEKDLSVSEEKLKTVKGVLKQISDMENAIAKNRGSIVSVERHIRNIQSEIDDLRDRGNDTTEQEEKLKSLRYEMAGMTTDRDKIVERKHYMDMIGVMLKDTGIKTKIIKQYIPIINRSVNKYLAAMDFFATFSLDENFKDKIHIRGSKERTYTQLSEGQKLRIDLAILFTWRDVAKLKNSANTNILIMDEIFESALDDTGVEDFLKLIQAMSKDVNIFIISPKGDPIADKFNNTIKFVESHGFAVMEK